MKEKKLIIKFGKKKIGIKCYSCSVIEKLVGLMFKSKEKSEILLFDFKWQVSYSIHSFFVFFDFLAVYVDENNKVIEIIYVKPWTVYVKPKKSYYRLIEIPINNKNQKLLNRFNLKRK